MSHLIAKLRTINRARVLALLTLLVLAGAGLAHLYRARNPVLLAKESDRGVTPVVVPTANSLKRSDLDYLWTALEALNCARANDGAYELEPDRALTEEAVARLELLRSPGRGDEYERRMAERPDVRSDYRVVFPAGDDLDNPCRLTWFASLPDRDLLPLTGPMMEEIGIAGASDGSRFWIVLTWRSP